MIQALFTSPESAPTPKLQHASGLYLKGIRDGEIETALKAHTGERYTQHSTGVSDGQQGFKDFFTAFLERCSNRDIRIIRAIEDGPYVFLHVYQNLNNGETEWITADLFDTDTNDRIIEHWDVIQAFEAKTKSGRSMIDGPAAIESTDQTQTNKAIVQNFCDVVLIGGQYDRMAEFISADQYDQHNPEIADGLDGLKMFIADLAKSDQTMRYWKIHKLIGQGNFVVTLGHMQKGQSHYCVFDIYRFNNGYMVEHWDVTERILAPEEWKNQGKF